MISGFPEWTFGGLLVSPFIPQAVVAFAVFMLARPLRRLVVVERTFANPPLAEVCLYLAILALVMLVS